MENSKELLMMLVDITIQGMLYIAGLDEMPDDGIPVTEISHILTFIQTMRINFVQIMKDYPEDSLDMIIAIFFGMLADRDILNVSPELENYLLTDPESN